jgi:CheY-like chemotaxis protein
MHTADTATAITRLTNLGLEPYKVAESLSAVVAQRLVRSLCPYCCRVFDDLEARRRGLDHQVAAVSAAAGPGCDHCKFTGYSGRLPVTELLTPSDDLRDAIVRGATAHEIRTAMRAAGVTTMREQALRLVVAGRTSIEEVNRVLSGGGGRAARQPSKSRVLVADDEPITRMLVKLLLEKQHYEVLEAGNGRDAVEIAAREHPDLVLCDLNMPEMDGYEAIARMRRDLSLALMPILVLTAEEGPAVEQRVLQLGADDYIVKPFDPEVLLSRVNAVFRRLKVIAA